MFREGHHYAVEAGTGCWRWLLYVRKGYPRASGRAAHRWLYEQTVGPIPLGHDLHHTCPNTDCVNPAHLEPREHGLHLAKHWRARSKLTDEDVLEIRERAWAGESLTQLAKEFPACDLSAIVAGTAWRDVGGPTGRPPIPCGYCGGPLTGLRSRRYCSNTCRQMAYFRRKEQRSAA
jgi:hypothetical protein